MKASILILDYKKAAKVVENVASIHAQKTQYDYEIIIVDNSCDVQNAEILRSIPEVQLQINKENNGYTRGNNQAVRKASGEYLFIVNPDIVWEENTLEHMINYLEKNPEVAVLAPRQKNPDGTDAMTVRAWPTLTAQIARRTFLRHLPKIKTIVAADERQDFDYNKVQDVPWVQSSFCAVRRDFWDSVGGFDEDYFIFMADTELCLQAHCAQKRVVYYPKAVVHADGLRCSDGGFLSFFQKPILKMHLTDSRKFTQKHKGEKMPK